MYTNIRLVEWSCMAMLHWDSADQMVTFKHITSKAFHLKMILVVEF